MIKLIVTDIDNTLFDWVDYYANAIPPMLKEVESITKVPYAQLSKEASKVFTDHSIEYPFVVQELPSVIEYCNHDVDRMLREVAEPSRAAFKDAAAPHLIPYKRVIYTLDILSKTCPNIPIVALTDAPRYIAMWKLNKLGILHYFDSVFGLEDPMLPIDKYDRVKVDSDVLMKHIKKHSFDFKGKVRILPDEYEKPGVKGFKSILVEYEIEDPKQVLWIGDNVTKDVALGKKLGVVTAWAKYGATHSKKTLKSLQDFAPQDNLAKHSNMHVLEAESPQPDLILESFDEILPVVRQDDSK